MNIWPAGVQNHVLQSSLKQKRSLERFILKFVFSIQWMNANSMTDWVEFKYHTSMLQKTIDKCFHY